MKNRAKKLKVLGWGFWPLFFYLNAIVNALSVIADHQRNNMAFAVWEPWAWELTSATGLILLVPLILALDSRLPFQKETWKRSLGLHLAMTVPFSLAHVGFMVALRKGIYALAGGFYDFGNVPFELFYEYRKDVLTYFAILAIVYGYRHFRYRYFEASLEPPKTAGKTVERVLIKTGGRETFLRLDQIDRLEAAGNYVNIHAGEARFFLRSTLAKLEKNLPGSRFIRVHRSNIVNVDRIRDIIPTPSGDGRINLEGGGHVPLSRRYRDRLKALEIQG